MRSFHQRRGLDLVERAVELPICIVLLMFFAPMMLLTALAVKLQDGGPILFGHVRYGCDRTGSGRHPAV